MSIDETRISDPGFLRWLDRFVGEWRFDGSRVTVARTDNGWLRARPTTSGGGRLLDVLTKGTKESDAPDILGPRPVCLSAELARLWLSPPEQRRFRGAGNVGAGIRALLKAIERAVEALPPDERWQRQIDHWRTKASTVDALDQQAFEGLWDQYSREKS